VNLVSKVSRSKPCCPLKQFSILGLGYDRREVLPVWEKWKEEAICGFFHDGCRNKRIIMSSLSGYSPWPRLMIWAFPIGMIVQRRLVFTFWAHTPMYSHNFPPSVLNCIICHIPLKCGCLVKKRDHIRLTCYNHLQSLSKTHVLVESFRSAWAVLEP
jgi:hypothetical protein